LHFVFFHAAHFISRRHRLFTLDAADATLPTLTPTPPSLAH